MPKLFILPNGDAVSPEFIKAVRLLEGKGVACHDASQRLIAWIPISNTDKAKRVRDILIRNTDPGFRPPQPDWSFLDEDIAE